MFFDQQHFVYQEAVTFGDPATALIWDAWYDGVTNSWNLQQINGGAPNGQTDGPLSWMPVLVSVFGDQQHFVYTDTNGTLWDAWYEA